jgi:carbon monoxide dehydrogenase subunit G
MKKARTVTAEIEINSPKDKVWDVLFNQFGHVNNFNHLIEGSQPIGNIQGEVGAERSCDINSSSKLHERISAVRGTESFDVEVLEGGLPMMDKMAGTWDVEEINPSTARATIHFSYTTKPSFMAGILKFPMTRSLHGVVVGLKYHIETGGLVTKKNVKKIVKEYKKLAAGTAFKHSIDLAVAA